MNCIVNLAAVASGDIGISYCQEVSTAGFCSAISLREDTGWGLKQVLKDSLNFLKKYKILTWCFSGGEIFEHPDILEILEIIETEWMKESFRIPLFLTSNFFL